MLPVRFWIGLAKDAHLISWLQLVLVFFFWLSLCFYSISTMQKIEIWSFFVIRIFRFTFWIFATVAAAHNQSLIGSKLATPQKLQPQPTIKAANTPTNQPRQAIMPVPTPRTPINLRSMPPTATSLITPSFGQYKIGSPTPIVGECILLSNKFSCVSVTSGVSVNNTVYAYSILQLDSTMAVHHFQ